MQTDGSRKVIVVLGSGRSGTSMLMKFLAECGMRVSTTVVPASEQNPNGSYEDLDIFTLQSKVLSMLGAKPPLPIPEKWFDEKDTSKYVKMFAEILKKKNDEFPDSIWGFKDPRTAMLMPLWTMAFNKIKVVPLYILAVREPKAVVESLKRQYRVDRSAAELFWLQKNCDSIFYTGGNIFIVHYEEWFSQKTNLAYDLINYCGLNDSIDSDKIEDITDALVQPSLNRAVHTDQKVENNYVTMFYDVLLKCRGANFDRELLMEEVLTRRHQLGIFNGYLDEGFRIISKQDEEVQNNTKRLNRMKKKIDKLSQQLDQRDDFKQIVQGQYELTTNMMENFLSEFKNSIERVRRIKKRQKAIEQENFRIITSYSYRIGETIANAFARPGKNTIMLPLKLFTILLEAIIIGRSGK